MVPVRRWTSRSKQTYLHHLMGLLDSLPAEYLVHGHLDPALLALHQRQDLLLKRREEVLLIELVPRPQRRPLQRQTLVQHLRQVEVLDHRAREGGEEDESAARGERVDVAREVVLADKVNDDVDAGAVRLLRDDLGKVLSSVVDPLGRSVLKRRKERNLVVRSGSREDVGGAERSSDLVRCDSNSRCSGCK